MESLKPIANLVALTGLLFFSFLTGALYGQRFEEINWSTIFAGFLGLAGGACALLAARWERQQRVKIATFKFYEFSRASLSPLIRLMQNELIALKNGQKQPSIIDRELIGYLDRMLPEVTDDLPLKIIQAYSRMEVFKVNISTPISISEQDTQIHRKVLADALELGIINALQLQTELEKYGSKIKLD
ncbi:hypothetical protein IT893_06770 [Thalassospira sp. A40-3]|uniref:hypothetical protein n=1 Tax=Thalassospira TaxID=168934 RepID=UPI0002871B19|nr:MULTISPECIES: hypothetical protein [Thalassospira]EKF08212.1 hypothetical protein TH2_11929 [Thalassospira profundimaris WP0211]QPO13209.1 hypothetical protein IT893_06770 [Thalassospira sp. A40-3]